MEFKDLIINQDQILNLYQNNSWFAYLRDKDSLFRGINNSLDKIGAYENGELVGLIRTIGDSETILYIQDILVLKECQGNGIGRRLLNLILKRYPNVRQINLATDNQESTKSFYKSLGFKEYKEADIIGFYFERK